MPFIEEWNDLMQSLFSNYNHVLMDETFIPWVPKTSKLGGLPNYSWEPRKPKGLGTMLKDSAEAVTGVLIYTDPVMAPSVQDKKSFGDKKSQSPHLHNKVHAPHVAEVLRQAHYSNLRSGNWVGGDAWFGSMEAAVALKK